MGIFIPRDKKFWQRKPVNNYEINRNHPLGSKIILSNNDTRINDVGATYGEPSQYGTPKSYASNNSYSYVKNDLVSGASKRSVFALINRTTDGSTDGIFSLDDGAGGTASGERWSFAFSNGKLRIEVQGGGHTSAIAVSTNVDTAVGISFDGTNLGGHAIYRKYIESGVYKTELSSGSNTVNTALENAYFGCYYDTSGSRGLYGDMYDCWLFDDELSEDDFLSLAEAPYQILKPRREYWMMSAPPGPGPTLALALVAA